MGKNQSITDDQALAAKTLQEIDSRLSLLSESSIVNRTTLNTIIQEFARRNDLDVYFGEMFERVVQLKFPKVVEIERPVIVPKIEKVEVERPIEKIKIRDIEKQVVVTKEAPIVYFYVLYFVVAILCILEGVNLYLKFFGG